MAKMNKKMKYYDSKTYYAGYKGMNEQNKADGSMLMEANLGMANMPQNTIIKAYPNPYQYPDNRVMTNSDNMMGIDANIGVNMSRSKKYGSKVKI